MELAYEHDFGGMETKSALVGAIWQVDTDVAIDAGFRGARLGAHSGEEVRVGVTFAFSVTR
jgi:hypothetical protein